MRKYSRQITNLPTLGIAAVVCLLLASVFFSSPKKNPATNGQTPYNVATTTKNGVRGILQPTLSLSSDHVIQGEPVLIRLTNMNSASTTLSSLTFNGESLRATGYGSNKQISFIGIDLDYPPGLYSIRAAIRVAGTSTDLVLKKTITIVARPRVTAPLGIPDKLGGNTIEGQQNVESSMASDNAVLNSLHATDKPLWTGAFDFPIVDPIVTDPYGYDRLTGSLSIPHKGTDFRAATGTPVMAVNVGVVIYAQDLGIYGNTIAVDHGLGILSFYMHLSRIGVKAGDMVARGQLIGQSGDTGYAVGPHLHLTIRIRGVSIDPMAFLGFFQ